MVLDKLGDSLKSTFNKIAQSLFVDEKLINELVKEIQRALLQSDTNVQLVFSLSQKIKERAKEDAPAGITKREQLIKIVYEELTNFLGKEAKDISITTKPTQIMLVGLFGSGKTTTSGKLAKFFTKRGFKVVLAGLDVHRPAAMNQIEQIGKQINVPVATIHARIRQLHELNPMLGHRGCRLGITYPEVYEMQVRAIMEAACTVAKEGIKVSPEIMIPLTGHTTEMKIMRELCEKIVKQELN